MSRHDRFRRAAEDIHGQGAEVRAARARAEDRLTGLVDSRALGRYLEAHHPDRAGPFAITRLGEGQSCLTFLVVGDDWELVLRRPPRGELPRGAFDVAREFRVLSALAGAGAPVPIPRPLSVCEDSQVLGATFFLMEHVRGETIRDDVPPALSAPAERRRMGEELVDVLLALRGVDWRAAGLAGFGRPEGYLERQLRRMGQQWEGARERPIPEIDAVGAWLADNLPASPPAAIVHGDLKLDNVILAAEAPARVAAVIDWELSTIGDPMADLGWLLYFWRDPGEEQFRIPVARVTDQPGFARRADLVARYVERGGSSDNAAWYAALAGWKIAIIMENSYRRYLTGVADHPTFAALDEGVPHLARRALDFSRGVLTISRTARS